MAVDAPLLWKQTIFAAKTEATTGTAEALTAAECAYNAFNFTMEPDIPANERQGQSSLSQLPQVPGARKGTAAWMTELFGNGSSAAAPPWASTLLPAAGWSITSATATPITGNSVQPTLTVGRFQDGMQERISGASLDFTIKGKAGGPLQIDWKAEGLWNPPAAVALPTPTYPVVIPPRFASATFTLGGTAYKISTFEFACNNKIYLREDVTDPSGYHAAVVVDRKLTIKIDPEALALGTFDPYAGHLAGTTYAFSLAIGSALGNTMTIAAPVAQLMSPPKKKDRGGIVAYDLEFQLNRSASAGDDEASLVWS